MRRRNKTKARRAGTSVVEFSIVAPVVFLVILALIQFAGLLMRQNVLTAAAREGGRIASLPSTDSQSIVENAVKDKLQRSGIDRRLATVTVTPSTLSNVSSGDELRVTVSAPMNQLSWIWAVAPPDANLSAEITYERE